ncbi:MAG: dTDP-4-dehydrorhamnose reductase [bacterium]
MGKILIIGAKGMLGRELTRVFANREVFAWDLEDIDISSEEDAREKIIALRPDVIINAAAYNNVDKAESEKEKADLLNGYAPGYLAKIADEIGAVFVHYSTDYVFDGERREGYNENDAPNPINVYGASKLLGEREALAKAKKCYIIRLSRLFGQAGSGQAVKKSFVDTMLDLAKDKKELKVVDEEMSSPTYAPDLAERTKYILENNLPYGIYHATNSGGCTWYEFAKEIFKLKNIEINLIKAGSGEFKRAALRPQFSVLLNTKLPAMRDWRDALGEYLKFKI